MGLKDRNRQVPGGMTFIQPETGWKPIPWSSFSSICQQLQQHRRGNPWLAKKHNWPLDLPGIEQEVEAYVVKICEAHGWHDFIASGSGASPPNWSPPQRPQEGGLVVGAKRTVAGVKLVRDWLGSGLKPVERGLATKRAAICVQCPLNQEGDFWQRLDALAAQQVKTLMSIRSDMDLKTDYDDRLKSCQACDCWNPLKVWTPLVHILKNTSPEIKAKLHPNCWILAEEIAGG